jgi:outer membrane receptor protein involved in Fe transport
VNSTKRHFASGISVAAVAVALSVASPAYAQTTAGLRGEGATPGATVTATDTVTGRAATTTVNPDGTFVIPGLRPSTYRVEGAGAPQVVELPVGQTVTIDAAPAPADTATTTGPNGAIVVTGRRNRQEVRSATVGTSVSQQQIENLPQNDRNFLNFAALAPGVTVSPDVGVNNKRIQAGGVSADNVNVYIDGTSHKNRVGFNGVAGQNFSQGNPFPQSAVQEFRVETQNFKAEYEQAGSAIITAITKTGGKEFHGGVFGEFMPKKWFGSPFFDRTNGQPKPDYKRYQFGADIGGPIIPGVLHFFAAYEGTRQNNPQSFTVTPPAALEGFDQEVVPSKFRQDLYFGKLTLFATEADTLHASFFKRKENDVRDYGGNRARSTGRNVGTATKNYQLEWNHRADNWLNELTLSYFDSDTGTPRLTEGPEIRLVAGIPATGTTPADPFNGSEFFTGANSFVQANRQKDKNFKNNFTYTGIDGHVIKAGVRFSKNELIRVEEAFKFGQYSFTADYTGFDSSIPFRAVIAQLPPLPITAKNTYVGLFAQDDWTVNDHLTVNYGLRWDFENNNFNQKYRTPDNVATALRNYVGWQVAGIDAEDYISTGSNRKPYKKAFAPRLGISYDVFGNRDLIFFGGAGRYYDRNNFYTASLEQLFNEGRSDVTVEFCNIPNRTCAAVAAANGGTLPSNYLAWNDAYRNPDAIREAIGGAGLRGNIWALNNKTPPPYTDQFNIGVRKRFGDWQTSATIAHNRGHNQFIYVRGNRMPDGSYTPAGYAFIRDNFPVEGRPAGYTGRVDIGSSKGESRYTALYLQAEKPWTEESRWGATAALTLSNAKSNQAHTFGDAEMYNAGEQDAYGWQPVTGLERWRFVGTGQIGLPLDIRMSTNVTLASGPRFGYVSFNSGLQPCGGCIPFNDAGVLKPEKPVAYKTVDVRLAKRFVMPWGNGNQYAEASFQVFNLFDWVNRGYEIWGAGNAGDGLDPPLKQNSTVGPARSFQAGLKYRF